MIYMVNPVNPDYSGIGSEGYIRRPHLPDFDSQIRNEPLLGPDVLHRRDVFATNVPFGEYVSDPDEICSNQTVWLKNILVDYSDSSIIDNRGYDWDHSGNIEFRERLKDYNHDNVIDENDFLHYVEENKNEILQALPSTHFLRWAIESDIPLDNPIHTFMYIESEVAEPEDVQRSYEVLGRIFSGARSEVADLDINSSSYDKLILLNRVLNIIRVQGQPEGVLLLSDGLSKEEPELDCDTGSHIYYSLAYEFGWDQLHVVRSPRHMFLRWDGDNHVSKDDFYHLDFSYIYNEDLIGIGCDPERLNPDNENSYTEDELKEIIINSIWEDLIQRGYIDRDGTIQDVFDPYRIHSGQLDRAFMFLERSVFEVLQSNSVFNFDTATVPPAIYPDSYYIEGHGDEDLTISQVSIDNGCYLQSCTYEEMVGSWYCWRGYRYEERGDYESALRNYEIAFNLDENDPYVLEGLAYFNIQLGHRDIAEAFENRVIELDPNYYGDEIAN
ncbi:type IV pilus biogenesis/stability protein PilW [Candidatus Margulisiibacteriota bacterium]